MNGKLGLRTGQEGPVSALRREQKVVQTAQERVHQRITIWRSFTQI